MSSPSISHEFLTVLPTVTDKHSTVLSVVGMVGASCGGLIDRTLNKVPGAIQADMNPATGHVSVKVASIRSYALGRVSQEQ
jgi:copper chaperone CopZ